MANPNYSLNLSDSFYDETKEASYLTSHETDSLLDAILNISLKDEETKKLSDAVDEQEILENYSTPETKHFDFLSSNILLPIEKEESKVSSTLVILHEGCIKHEFERNKHDLKYIVERPRRYRAAIIGTLSAKAHLDLLDKSNSFDIYQSVRYISIINNPIIEFIHGEKWPLELYELCKNVQKSIIEGKTEIPEDKYHSGDLYLGQSSLEAFEGCVGAIYDGIDRCLAENSQVKNVHVLLRPPGHHCSREIPSGFCLLNNALIAISYAHKTYGITHFAILDFDLHHGDGSQEISWRINQETNINLNIGYFSLHDIYSFPCEGTGPSVQSKIKDASICIMNHNQAIWNVHIEKYTTYEEFEELYNTSYINLLKKADFFFESTKALPEQSLLVISAGFDSSEFESEHMQRHGYHLPALFYWKFSKDTLLLSQKRCCSRIFSIMEGGYSDRAIASGTFTLLCGLTNLTQEQMDQCKSLWKMEYFSWIDKSISKGTISRLPKNALLNIQIDWIKNIIQMAQKYTTILETKTDLILSEDRMTLRERKKPLDSSLISLIDQIQKIKIKPIKSPQTKNTDKHS
ncbi:hypothetical protein T552_00491 [Pneumocystis carinii B80]|uniref:Histone deacetylase domain-containing protein n=1 Tax=Pneumocystis carinii (strain B80) TaxID=1408658 RepID=A0A0W4ZQY2_PNEC8|nr:hypothetical protein T552_00491 [Pneumocystis carinii B80]KTW30779.1 hypothetical protein T552_00491 [Pneumocystis carinii B80]